MVVSANKRSIMTLYSGKEDIYSHRVRIVLAEKGVSVDILDVDSSAKLREEILELNPYGRVPILVDRDLVLYRSEIIMEYLDERFPHPPLMPVYPVAKGRSRLMIYRVNHDWYTQMEAIVAPDATPDSVKVAKEKLVDSMVSVTRVFEEMTYFLSEEFSLIDCCIAPMLWRLPKLGVQLPKGAEPIMQYAERIFARDSFQASLTDAERMMRLHDSN